MSLGEQLHQIYQKLSDVLNKMLNTETQKPLTQKEQFLTNNQAEQVNQIKTLIDKINDYASDLNSSRANYLALEKQVQKYESEIRKHIRMEQQIKLYAESLQQKYEDSEATRGDMLETTKTMINGVRRENQGLYDQVKTLKQEIEHLKNQLKDQEKGYEDKIKQLSIFQERIKVLEGIGHEPKQNNYLSSKVQRQSSQRKVQQEKTQSEVTSASQTIDNSAFGNTNKRNDYFKVKIEIENSKESQRKKNTSLHYNMPQDRPLSLVREKKSQTVHQQPKQFNLNSTKQYSSGNNAKPFISNPSSINNSIHIVSNYQNLIKSRQGDSRHLTVQGNWTQAKKIIGSRNKVTGLIQNNDISKTSKVSQDYTEFLEQDIGNYE